MQPPVKPPIMRAGNSGAHATMINDIITREFQSMRQWHEQRHVRLEKLMHSNAKQVTQAVVQAIQSQLRSTQHQMQLTASNGFKTPGQFPTDHLALAVVTPSGTAEKFFPHPEDDSRDLFRVDDLEDTEPFEDFDDGDEDAARQAQYQAKMASAKKRQTGKSLKLKGDAWGSDQEDSAAPAKPHGLARTAGAVMGGQEGKMKQMRELRAKTMQWHDEQRMPPGRVFARRVVFHPRFEWVVSAILVVCAVVTGIETSWSMGHVLSDQPIVFRVLDIAFNICFFIELVLRFAADYGYFVSMQNPSLFWNILDIVLVGSAMLEGLVGIVQLERDGAEGSAIRVVRLVRLVRVARIVRLVRFFSDLRVMVNGIKMSARALLWALLLLMLVIYMYGVMFMQLAVIHMQYEKTADSELKTFYGSMGATIGTLFMTISGGILWHDAVKPLAPIGWAMEPLFGTFVVFTLFCCLNIVTGILVENAQNSKKNDEFIIRREYAKERRRYMQDVANLFHKLDMGSKGEVAKAEFERGIRKEAVQTLFRKLNVPLDGYDSVELWNLFDLDQMGVISEDEFALAIRQFQGNARSLDVAQLRKDTTTIRKQLERLTMTMGAS
eukprot:TRINITY_DN11510_c0_g1_i1.p1 TRINITY_DN11510_c0_g1~~TRINITY_DN11510_c0_g1_i1.p1  ORF type:complete len:632 (-),score=104.15 TRINITY_DN11510_c0_g1_i1:56-1879(-)